MSAHDGLDGLVDDLQRTHELIQSELDLLADGCEHTHVFCADMSSGGNLWMCSHCFQEWHGWSLYWKMKADWEKKISFDAFIGKRPPGRLRMLK